MSGDPNIDESQFKGLSKYFNSHTNRGRINVNIFNLVLVKTVIITSTDILFGLSHFTLLSPSYEK